MILLPLYIVIATFLGLWLVRIEVVRLARTRELNASAQRAREAFAHGENVMRDHYEAFHNGPSYDQMLWQLHKWTHKHFYPASNT